MSVPESVPVGSVVGRIWAKDRDTGVNAEMKYSIIDGDGRDTFDILTDPTNHFGIITVKRVKEQAYQIRLEKKKPRWSQLRVCIVKLSLSCLFVVAHKVLKLAQIHAD